MSNEELSDNKTLKNIFEGACLFLGEENLSINRENLEMLISKLQGKANVISELSDKDKFLLFVVDFYGTFLTNIFPAIENIIKQNESDLILSQKLNPPTQKLNSEVNSFIEYTLQKYNFSNEFPYKDDSLISDLVNFKSIFIKKSENEKFAEFDYNIDNWNEKKKKMQSVVNVCKKQVVKKMGEDYHKYITGFDAEILKNALEEAMFNFEPPVNDNNNNDKHL